MHDYLFDDQSELLNDFLYYTDLNIFLTMKKLVLKFIYFHYLHLLYFF